MTDSERMYIVLRSDDPASIGNSFNFTTTLSNTINLNYNLNYELAVISGSYPTPEPYTNKSVHFLCDLVDYSYVGGVKQQLIHKTNVYQKTAIQQEITHFEISNPVFFRMNKRTFNTIKIEVQDEDGTIVPLGQTSCVLYIRPVS